MGRMTEREPHIVNLLRSKAIETRSLLATLEVLARELGKGLVEELKHLLPLFYFTAAFDVGLGDLRRLGADYWFQCEGAPGDAMQACFELMLTAWDEQRFQRNASRVRG